MNIKDLFDPALLEGEIEAKRVRVNDHPTEPLRLFNYTELAQYQKAWNPVTRACRGLIINRDTGEVLARPFPKFFNHGETTSEVFSSDEQVIVTDKLDGSLGIIYSLTDGSLAVATRGSFTSEQAIHATEVLATKYPEWSPAEGQTVLVEIVYPNNRIVVDYGNTDDLILLGAVDIETGITSTPLEVRWDGPRTDVFPFNSFEAALSVEPRKNSEGLVVHFRTSDVRVKIKQEDYVALHRIVTGWNERTIWERLASGQSLDLLIEGLPDEFHRWATEVADELAFKHKKLTTGAEGVHAGILAELPTVWERKDYAIKAAEWPDYRPALFHLLDGRDISPWAWKAIYPTYSEQDAAA